MIAPDNVRIAVLACFLAALVQRAGVYLGFWTQEHDPNLGFSLLIVASYISSFALCLRIAREHENSPGMHAAWILFAGSCAFSVVRHCAFCIQASGAYPNFDGKEFYLASQVPMAIALILFFVGLICMWSAISALGLGFHPKRIDAVAVTAMILMLPPILSRDTDQSPAFIRGWIAILPFAGATLLPACAAIAVFLHRTAIQMRGGETARYLRYLICYPALRLVAMLISVDSHLNRTPALMVFAYAIFHTAPLVLTLALAYRWRITAKATEAMRSGPATWERFYPAGVKS